MSELNTPQEDAERVNPILFCSDEYLTDQRVVDPSQETCATSNRTPEHGRLIVQCCWYLYTGQPPDKDRAISSGLYPAFEETV